MKRRHQGETCLQIGCNVAGEAAVVGMNLVAEEQSACGEHLLIDQLQLLLALLRASGPSRGNNPALQDDLGADAQDQSRNNHFRRSHRGSYTTKRSSVPSPQRICS